MRKVLYFILITMMMVCMACGDIQPEISDTSTEYETAEVKTETKEESSAEVVSKKEYFQYSISYPEKDWSDYETDIAAICAYIGFDAEQLKQDTKVVGEGEHQTQYEVLTATVDGVTHEFRISSTTLSYSCDLQTGSNITVKTASEMAEKFLSTLPYMVDSHYDNNQQEGELIGITYRLCWEDVPMMGSQTLYFTSDENEIPLTGSYINFTMCENGIQNMSILYLPEVGEVMRTYQEEDLLTEEEIYEMATYFVEETCSKFQRPYRDIVLEDWKLIYMPYKLNGEETVLLPAYEVQIHTIENEKGRTRYLWMDAVTGFIYENNYVSDR